MAAPGSGLHMIICDRCLCRPVVFGSGAQIKVWYCKSAVTVIYEHVLNIRHSFLSYSSQQIIELAGYGCWAFKLHQMDFRLPCLPLFVFSNDSVCRTGFCKFCFPFFNVHLAVCLTAPDIEYILPSMWIILSAFNMTVTFLCSADWSCRYGWEPNRMEQNSQKRGEEQREEMGEDKT